MVVFVAGGLAERGDQSGPGLVIDVADYYVRAVGGPVVGAGGAEARCACLGGYSMKRR